MHSDILAGGKWISRINCFNVSADDFDARVVVAKAFDVQVEHVIGAKAIDRAAAFLIGNDSFDLGWYPLHVVIRDGGWLSCGKKCICIGGIECGLGKRRF